MTYLSLCNDDGIQDTAIVDDPVWNDNRPSIERAARAAGFSVRVSNVADGLHPGKACHSLSEVATWIADEAGWVG